MSRELVGALPITDAEIKATRLLAGELLSHPDVVRVCDALLEARAALKQIREWAIQYDLDEIKDLLDSSALLPEEST